MTRLHCQHLKADIDHYIESTSEKMVDILEFVADKDNFFKKNKVLISRQDLIL